MDGLGVVIVFVAIVVALAAALAHCAGWLRCCDEYRVKRQGTSLWIQHYDSFDNLKPIASVCIKSRDKGSLRMTEYICCGKLVVSDNE